MKLIRLIAITEILILQGLLYTLSICAIINENYGLGAITGLIAIGILAAEYVIEYVIEQGQ